MIWFAVGLGGAVGSMMRYGTGRLAVSYWGSSTVLATLLVNVTGSFLLGLFMTLVLGKLSLPAEYRALVAVGLLGGFTTFSTFSFEVVQLAESGALLRAGATVIGNVVLGLSAAYLGVLVARLV